MGRAYLPFLLCFPKHSLLATVLGRNLALQSHPVEPSLCSVCLPVRLEDVEEVLSSLSLTEEGMQTGHFLPDPLF